MNRLFAYGARRDCLAESDLLDMEVPMPREATTARTEPNRNRTDEAQKPIKQLSVKAADANKVKGGLTRKSDPCEGGE